MTNHSSGHEAERYAAEYLKTQNYEVLELNWKTKYCEIDIVAKKDKTIFLTEVKYRQSSAYGSGLEYITAGKIRQMRFAAEMWVNNHTWTGNYQLAAIELTGLGFQVTAFLSDL